MPRGQATTKDKRMPRLSKDNQMPTALQHVLWRLDRLERQVRTLSELVRDHAEDSDRLVTIVAEDRDVLRRELLREHQARLRVRKGARAAASDAGPTGQGGKVTRHPLTVKRVEDMNRPSGLRSTVDD